MRYYLFIPSILAALTLSACMKPRATEVNNFKEISREEENKETQAPVAIPEKPVQGGLPRLIKVSGMLIEEHNGVNALNPHIEAQANFGSSSDNTQNELPKELFPKISRYSDMQATRDLEYSKELIYLGCTSESIQKVAKSQGLTVKPFPNSSTVQFVNIKAHSIAICGNVQLRGLFTHLSSHRLYLVSVNLLQTGAIRSLVMRTNHLRLVGRNQLTSLQTEASAAAADVPAFDLDVMSTLDAGNDAKLTMKAFGANAIKN